MDGPSQSYALLTERIASIPDRLREALEDDAPVLAREGFPRPEVPLTVVGAGGSSGPAGLLAACLNRAGWLTRVRPLSQFALDARGLDAPLAVVSQGLSPNARLVLARGRARTLLVTAAATSTKLTGDALTVVRHGPASEPGLLVRVVGPVLASLAAVRFAGLFEDRELCRLPAAVMAATAACPTVDGPFDLIALVTAGDYHELAHGLRWKLLETLGFGDPPVYDVLQFVHGPYQQLYDRRALLLVLDCGTPEEERLYAGLSDMLVPDRHTLLRLRATLPAPLCWFEHDAQLNRLVLALSKSNPRDLVNWSGKHRDQGLYGIER